MNMKVNKSKNYCGQDADAFCVSFSAYTPNGRKIQAGDNHLEITLYYHGEYNYMELQSYSLWYFTYESSEVAEIVSDLLADLRGQGLEELKSQNWVEVVCV
jgi:hypothetical protein